MTCTTTNIPVADHGELDGLSDDDHTQYLLLAGRTAQQNLDKGITYSVITLTDGATPALDASLGDIFTLTSVQNPTIGIPTNPPGTAKAQKIIIFFTASTSDRTLSLNTGTGGFRFGADITGLSATTANKTDMIGCVYKQNGNYWAVVSYIKGF